MEKKLFDIEYGNVILVVRPNGDTVIVTEAGELVLDNAVMEQIVRNSCAYKSFVDNRDDVVAGLERDNTKLQNEIVGLKEELESVKGANDNDNIHRLKRERIKLRNNIMNLRKNLKKLKLIKIVCNKSLSMLLLEHNLSLKDILSIQVILLKEL